MTKSATSKLTKPCHGYWCQGEECWLEDFRMLSHGYRASLCRDCEREYVKERRWWRQA